MSDQEEKNNNQQQTEQQYEEQLYQQRQQELNNRMAEQQDIAQKARYAKMMKIGGEGVVGEAGQQAVELAKQQLKKTVLKWLVGFILSILANPITWIIIAIVIVALIAGWCVDESIDCVKDFGFGAVFKTIMDVVNIK